MTASTDTTAALREALTGLKPSQAIAVEALATGSTHAEAALAAGVERETVSRWLGHHPGFQAALEAFRSASAAEQADRTRELRNRAVDVLTAVLETGEPDPRLALAVLHATSPEVERRPRTARQLLREAELAVGAALVAPALSTFDEMVGTTPPDREAAVRVISDDAGLFDS